MKPRILGPLLGMIVFGTSGLGPGACQRPAPPSTPLFFARAARLQLPQLPGWEADGDLDPVDASRQGGVVLRLVRGSQVPGSPRIEVVLEPPTPRATVLEEFLAHNLREMARLERVGQIHIAHVDQRRIQVGSQPAYRVHHEYTVGAPPAQVSINQVSIFTVRHGRGIAITAAGRIELYHPLAEPIARLLEGLSWSDEPPPPAGGTPADRDAQPVDLGRIGGPRKGA